MSASNLIDLQVNGFAGVDFNSDELTLEQIHHACRSLGDVGVGPVLATVITDDLDRMLQRTGRLATAIEASAEIAQTIGGLHLEGPFLNSEPGYAGAHPVAAMRPASVELAQRLLEAGRGHVRLVTLAPEQDPWGQTIQHLADRRIIVSAGHCNPSRAQLQRAIDHGLSMFTHLGNGCPLELPRHDNIVQRVLSLADRLWVCFIADGVHVPFHALGNYLQVVGLDRAIVVSDAIAAAGMGTGEFTLANQRVHVDEHFATWSADRSHLVGSALSQRQAFTNLLTHLSFSRQAALKLTRDNPRQVLSAAGIEGD